MIALAGSGRQAEALRIYDSLRRRLDDLLGVMPGAELADAQVRVLRHELADTSSRPPRHPGCRPSRIMPPATTAQIRTDHH
jgi:Bacterial transcriptional activator domain